MQQKTDSKFNQNLHLYSAHDTTLAPFLQLLNVYNDVVPPYSSAVMVELRSKGNEYVVTVSTKGYWHLDTPPGAL